MNKSLKIKRIIQEEKISSKKTKKKYTYYSPKGAKIKNKLIIERINKLRIPPNYNDVLIATKPTSKLQAIGYDSKGRKQYIYHSDYILENKTKKYEKYTILGKYLNHIENDYNNILNKIHNKPYSKWKQPSSNIAIILLLLNEALFRIGNHKYYEMYGSHGIITLQPKHIFLNNQKKLVFIKFIGKKGVINEFTFIDTIHYNIFKTLKNNISSPPDNFIFDFKTLSGQIYSLKGDDITKALIQYDPHIIPKMFRTWHTNCFFIELMKKKLDYLISLKKNNKLNEKVKKQIIKETCREISIKLHNTATVIKKSYLNDILLDLFMKNTDKFLKVLHKCKGMTKGKTLLFIEKHIRK